MNAKVWTGAGILWFDNKEYSLQLITKHTAGNTVSGCSILCKQSVSWCKIQSSDISLSAAITDCVSVQGI